MRVLGIEVATSLVADWQKWLAPNIQPFFVPAAFSGAAASAERELSPELRDTFRVYNVDRELRTVWLDETAFAALPRDTRARLVRAQANCRRGAVPTVRSWADLIDPQLLRAQADGHRFVWWPSLLSDNTESILRRVVSDNRTASRHEEVSERTWRSCAKILPGARALAGTFPRGSGANCFGTVMAACGEPGAADVWMLRSPFEEWLESRTRTGGDDDAPGTILVWRDGDGLVQHAAVTIGDGWGLEKPSQDWHSPRAVLGVREVVKGNRARGLRLQRRQVVDAIRERAPIMPCARDGS